MSNSLNNAGALSADGTPGPAPAGAAVPGHDGVQSPSAAFIGCMREVASSVTIVTTEGPAGRHGATVSAFSSVSADPPTILVCLRSDSRIGELVMANGVFTVNVLPEHKQQVARTFSGELKTPVAERFDNLELVEYADHAPGIQGATIFACKLVQFDVHHSHTVFIGEVVHTASSGSPPLTYYHGAYRQLQRDPVSAL